MKPYDNEDPKDDKDSFYKLEARVKRRRPIKPIAEMFQKLHTGPHSELLMKQFREKREALDHLSRKYNENIFRKD